MILRGKLGARAITVTISSSAAGGGDAEADMGGAALEQRATVPSPAELRILVGELIDDGATRRRKLDAWGELWYELFDGSDLERVIALLERHGAAGRTEEAAAGLGAVAAELRERLRAIDDLEDEEGTLRTLLRRCETPTGDRAGNE